MHPIKLHKLTVMQVGLFGVGGTFLGIVYISLEQGFQRFYPFVNGVMVGLLVGLMIGLFEIYLFKPRSDQSSFLWLLFSRVAVYMVSIPIIILIVVTLNRSVRYHQPFFEALISEESKIYLTQGKFKTAFFFTLVAALIANFTRLVSFKIGRGILTSFIMGAYHKPRLVQRVFLFIQITNSNQLLKRHSLESYHHFVNKVFREISIAVMYNNGYVYEYVDNQIIVYWNVNKRNWPTNLFNCYDGILSAMKQNESHFKETYNTIPSLVCIAHGGEVVQAEIGELKTEIVFHGDVLNTAGRMLSLALEKAMPFVISEYVHEKIKAPASKVSSIGPIELRGKQQLVHLFSVAQNGL